MRELELASEGPWAVGRDTRGYISDYKRPAADFYRVNTMTGERTLMFKGQLTGAGTLGISTDGKTFLYWKDKWNIIDALLLAFIFILLILDIAIEKRLPSNIFRIRGVLRLI